MIGSFSAPASRKNFCRILLGVFVLDVYINRHPLTSLAIASTNSLEGLAAAYLVNKYARGAKALDTAGDVVRFVFYACVVRPAISATIAIGTLDLRSWLRDPRREVAASPALPAISLGKGRGQILADDSAERNGDAMIVVAAHTGGGRQPGCR